MKRTNILSIISAIIMAVVIVSCGDGKDYLKALPSNSVVVAKMNFGNLLNESEALQDPQIKGALKESINQMQGDSRKLLRDLIEHPENSGLDLNQPAYLAIENLEQMRGVIIFSVSNEEQVKTTLSTLLADNNLNSKLTLSSQDGINTIEDNEGNAMGAFDAEKLVFAYSNGIADAIEYMTLSEENQKRSAELEYFIDMDTDAAFYADYGQVMNLLAAAERELEGIDFSMFKETKLIGSLNFDKGKVSVSYQLKGSKKLEELYNKVYNNASNDLVKYLPKNTWGVAQVGIKELKPAFDLIMAGEMGKKLQREFDKANAELAEAGIKTQLSLDLLNSIQGDAIIGVTPTIKDKEQNDPQIIAIAECKDRKLFDAILMIVKTEEDVEEVGKDVVSLGVNKRIDWDNHVWGEEYKYIRKGYDYYFGFADNKMFVLPENFYKQCVSGGKFKEMGKSLKDNDFLYNIIDNKNAGGIDLNALYNMLNNEDLSRKDRQVAKMIRSFAGASVEMKNSNEAEASVYLKDKETEALKQIKDALVQALISSKM